MAKRKAKLPEYDIDVELHKAIDAYDYKKDEVMAYVATLPATGNRDAVVRRLAGQEGWAVRRAFEGCVARSLSELAEKHPKELEELVLESFYARAVHDIHEGCAKVRGD